MLLKKLKKKTNFLHFRNKKRKEKKETDIKGPFGTCA